jgi:hypothetical protein
MSQINANCPKKPFNMGPEIELNVGLSFDGELDSETETMILNSD